MGSFIDVSDRFGGYLSLPQEQRGPLLLVLQEIFGVNDNIQSVCDEFAQEGYVAFAPDLFWRQRPGIRLEPRAPGAMEQALGLLDRFSDDEAMDDLRRSIAFLKARYACEGDVGAVGYCLGGRIAYLALLHTEVRVAASYYGVGLEQVIGQALPPGKKALLHVAGQDTYCPPAAQRVLVEAGRASPAVRVHLYPECHHAFARQGGDHFEAVSASNAYDRTIVFLKSHIGPRYDLEALWEAHLDFEFTTRDAGRTMATMVPSPYVNHIPTMTGGVGYADLHRFYSEYFIPCNPADMKQISVSRTVGVNQIVDEVIMSFTHDRAIEWLLPGVAPTGKFVKFGLIGVVKFRGNKICHEHIYWDQASVLAQVGLIDPSGLPVLGAEAAEKILDNGLASNRLIATW